MVAGDMGGALLREGYEAPGVFHEGTLEALTGCQSYGNAGDGWLNTGHDKKQQQPICWWDPCSW